MVYVKLYAGLKKFTPKDRETQEYFQVSIEGTSVADLLKKLGIKESKIQTVMINGERIIEYDQLLTEDDLVDIFPPIGGG
ncbi:MAG: MoaD/ThiS family protein [Candidatus Thorarchaeota archaeon]